MTVPGWNAQQFHERMQPDPAPSGGRGKRLTTIALAALVFGAVATAATQVVDAPDQVGVCHATGDAAEPYVWLLVDEDGYEHGHHRHHEGDFFRAASADGCGSDVLAGDAVEEPAVEEPESPAPAVDNETDVAAGVDNETAAGPENETLADNDGAPMTNETMPDNATEPPYVDAWILQEAQQDEEKVVLTLIVGNAGDEAADITVTDSLPDVRRSWFVGGPDAESCVLDGDSLSCWFPDMAPGETRQVELRAYTDRMPCGFSQTNTAQVSVDGDMEGRNDASSAGILARAC